MIGIRLLLRVANKQHMAGIACGNWQVHLFSDSQLPVASASCQLPDRASYGSCNCRCDIWLMTNLFTLSPCLAFFLLPCVTFSSVFPFSLPRKTAQAVKYPEPKEKCDIDRTMDWLYGKWVKISVCATSIRVFFFFASSIDVPALWSFHGIVLADWLIDPPDTQCVCL